MGCKKISRRKSREIKWCKNKNWKLQFSRYQWLCKRGTTTRKKELMEKIDGGEGKMLALVDMIRNENKMYINRGRKEGIMEIAKNLLKINMPISQIIEVTKLSKEEIEKIKN